MEFYSSNRRYLEPKAYQKYDEELKFCCPQASEESQVIQV